MRVYRTCACILGGTLALMIAAQALAAPAVALDADVFVERTAGGSARALEPADRLSRGERVVTIVSWQRRSGSDGFTLVNPVPRAIAFQASARDDEQVSIDGGRTWGRLGSLRVGGRMATPEDVTHVRWRIPARFARGQIAYSGIVR